MTENFSDDASRRQFLTGLAAAGAAATTMTSGLAFGQQAKPAKPKHQASSTCTIISGRRNI